jgi:hypothetical protein
MSGAKLPDNEALLCVVEFPPRYWNPERVLDQNLLGVYYSYADSE